MTLPMARDLGRFGIRVNTIAPGVFLTPMSEMMRPEVMKQLAGSQVFPSTRVGVAEEFAALVVHIIENRFMNAEGIRLDAGVRMPKL